MHQQHFASAGYHHLKRLNTVSRPATSSDCQPPVLTVSRQYDAGHPSYDDVTGRQHLPSPDRVSGTAFLLPSVIRHCDTVAISLRKAAENLFVCLRVAALVTYELAPCKCTD